MKKLLLTTTALGFIGFVTASFALDAELLQKSVAKKEEVFLEANQLDYFQEQGVVVATGKVEVQKGTNIVFADQIIYDQNQNIVTAQGNVSYVGPDGNAVFTDKVVLRDDLKAGVVDYFRARLDDGSLLAAAQARRINENRTELDKAVYSPCPLCDDGSDPQWQIKAEKVIVDNAEQKVKYEDAYMEVYGVPVFYAPYFSHPTPNADRKSGFLTPSFRTDSNLGGALSVPYYFNIAENMEATVTPIITTKEGLVLTGDYSHLTNYGKYNIEGSITRPRGFTELSSADEGADKELRGHLKGNGLFDLTENWDFGFDGEYTSDDTYLRRYSFNYTDLITSKAFFERINERNFTRLQAVHFRGLLETDNSDSTPLALPYLRSRIESNYGIIPGFSKSKLGVDLTSFNIDRNIGSNNQRGSLRTSLYIPHITNGGSVYELETSVRADQYFIENTTGVDSSEHRIIPEAALTWRLPMVSESGGNKALIEPIIRIIASPNSNYNKDVPNEDSQDIEFSELNLFSNNRYRGVDRVENGVRAQYGLRGGYYGQDYKIDYVVGQNLRLKEQRDAPVNSGIEDNLSDFVGRIGTSYQDKVDLTYRFRFDQKTLTARRHEVDLSVDYYPVKVDLGYFNLDYDFTNQADNREEITGGAQINITPEWSVIAQGTRNIAADKSIYAMGGLKYDGDCADVTAVVRKDYIDDRDAKSGTSFDIKLALKNLGEI